MSVRKIFFVFFIVITSVSAKVDLSEIEAIIEEASSCSKVDLDQFCTGLILPKEFSVKLLEEDRAWCFQEIKKHNHLVEIGTSDSPTWKSFKESTKVAETIHLEKRVFFKNEATAITCFHELLHVLQQDSKSKLAPSYRSKIAVALKNELEKDVERIEKLEKSKQLEKVKIETEVAQKKIDLYKKLDAVAANQDEIEVYRYLYFLLKDKKESYILDLDMILANLVKFQGEIGWRLKEAVLKDANELIKEKEQKILKSLKLIPLSADDKIIISERLEKKESADTLALALLWEKNPLLAEAYSSKPKELERDFATGKISKDEFETMALKYKLIKRLALLEKSKVIPLSIEEEFLLKARLSSKKEEELLRLTSPVTLSISEKEGLPYITLPDFKTPFLLDLGAMISILPEDIIKEKTKYELIPFKTTELQNALGSKLEVPVVLDNEPLLLSNNQTIKKAWAIADLKLPGIKGIVGADFFMESDLSLDLAKMEITISPPLNRPSGSFDLQKNLDNIAHAPELICTTGEVIRLDTGSQVLGDIKEGSKLNKCGNLALSEKFETVPETKGVFVHDTILNLGWPFIKKFKKVTISFKNGWVSIE